jgi:predicted O-methyltransferase YrrM
MRGAGLERLFVAALCALAIIAFVGGVFNSLAVVGAALVLSVGVVGLATVTVLHRLEARSAEQAELRREVASAAEGIARVETATSRLGTSLDRLLEDVARLDAIREHVDASTSRSTSSLREHVDRSLDRSTGEARAQVDAAVAGVESALKSALSELQESFVQQGKAVRWLQRNLATLTRHTRRIPGDMQAVLQLVTQHPPVAPLPDVGGWAMEPPALVRLVDTVLRRGPRLVVECGSGTSTLWIARALHEGGGGRLVSFEHEAEFLEKTKAMLLEHGLLEYVDLRHAPLVDTVTPRGKFSWYDVAADDIDEIDLLLVDGPPGTTGPHARYPAVPVLGDKLTPGATVIVDDVSRKEEQEMVEYWLEERPRLRRAGQLGFNAEALVLD